MREHSQKEKRQQYSIVDNEPAENVEETVQVVDTEEIEGSVVCPECGVMGPGSITSEIPVFIYALVLVLILVIGKWAFMIAPFLFLLINSQIRTCNIISTITTSHLRPFSIIVRTQVNASA